MKSASPIRCFSQGLFVALFWLGVWQASSMLVDKPVLFASPFDTLRALGALLPTEEYWLSILGSLWRVALGFFLALAMGLLLGSLSFRFSGVQVLISPLLTMIKTVPVASFIILILVWYGSDALTVIVCLLIVLPQIYFATLNGLQSSDRELLEMARVFRVPGGRVVWLIYRPALMPYLLVACASGLGMAWKAGIAAEVIGNPANSIGEQLYLAKIYMATAELFAWTLTVVLLSTLFEKLVMNLLRRVGG